MNYKLIAYAQDFTSFLLQGLGDDARKIKQVILFGSVSRGEADAKSDVDIFIDVMGDKAELKIKTIEEKFYQSIKYKKYWQLLGVHSELSCTIGKLEQWGDLQRSIIANGIVLFGKYLGKAETKPYSLFIVTSSNTRNKNLSVWRSLYGYSQKVQRKVYLKKGLVQEYEGKKLGRGIFIIPIEHTSAIMAILRKNSFQYQIIPFHQEV